MDSSDNGADLGEEKLISSVEFRPDICTCIVSLNFLSCKAVVENVNIHVSESQITIKTTTKSHVNVCILVLPNRYLFSPSTCSSLAGNFYCDKASSSSSLELKDSFELLFRVNVEDTFPDDDDGFQPAARRRNSSRSKSGELASGSAYMFHCRMCKQALFQNAVTFNRVLPLPSGDWKELASEWFCHKHEGSDELSNGNVLVPKQDDLFTSLTHIHVHGCHCSETVTEEANLSIMCSRCLFVLGRVSESELARTLEFARSRVDVKVDGPKGLEALPSVDDLSVVKSLMMEQLSSTVSCRLMLQNESNTSEYLLLWVIESGLHHFSTGFDICLETEESEEMMFRKVLKVLFCLTTKCSDKVKKWQEEDVLVYTVIKSAFSELSKSLLASSVSILPSQRFLDGFLVGLLPV